MAFYDGPAELARVQLDAAATATTTATTLSAGTHDLSAVFESQLYAGSTSPVRSITIDQVPTSLSLTAPQTGSYNQPIVLDATLTAGTAAIPASTITFSEDTTIIGTATTGGDSHARLTLTPTAGIHTYTARFDGSANFAPATAPAATLEVTPAGTSVALTASEQHPGTGETIGFTATVTSPYGTPTGAVDLTVDGQPAGSTTLIDGTALVDWTATTIGVHSIVGTFRGDPNWQSSTATLAVTVNTPVTVTVTPPPGPTGLGVDAAFTVAVSGAGGVPTGAVRLWEGTTLWAQANLDTAGHAVLITDSIPAGSHTLTVTYSGDSTFAHASQTTGHSVNQGGVTVTINDATPVTGDNHQAPIGITVSPSAPANRAPTGFVALYLDGNPVPAAIVALNGKGQALALIWIPQGRHMVIASYGGDTNYPTAASGPVTHTVVPGLEAGISLMPGPIGIAPYQVQVTTGDYPDAVYRWNFADGTFADGRTAQHTYAEAGLYPLTLTVTQFFPEGTLTEHATRTVIVTPDYPLRGDAGGNRITTTNTPTGFDASNSTPQQRIAHYQWDFGDGQTFGSASPQVTHQWAQPGVYSTVLTVTSTTGQQATDTITVTVEAPKTGLQVRVETPSGVRIQGATVGIELPGSYGGTITATPPGLPPVAGGLIEATTDQFGEATLNAPDGTWTVYAAGGGFIPNAGQVPVIGGSGSVIIQLAPGQIGVADLDVRHLTPAQAQAAGIDITDPDNFNVQKFTFQICFTDPIAPPGTQCSTGGPGGTPVSGYVNNHGNLIWCGGCAFNYVTGASVTVNNNAVMIMRIPVEARWLKEFFSAQLTIINLADTPFRFTNATASLQLPSQGIGLPELNRVPQNLTPAMADIPPLGMASYDWILRGDKAGTYNITAQYAATLEPSGLPITLTANAGFRVWGGDALRYVFSLDDPANQSGDKYYPYHVTVSVTNLSNIPVYNPTFTVADDSSDGFIFAPGREPVYGFCKRTEQPTTLFCQNPTIPPGATITLPNNGPGPDVNNDLIFIPKVSGKPDLGSVFAAHEPGDNTGTIPIVAGLVHPPTSPPATTPLLSKDPSGPPGTVTVHWAPIPGAAGYDIYVTDPFQPFGGQPATCTGAPCVFGAGTTQAGVDVPAGSQKLIAVRTRFADGHAEMRHNAITAIGNSAASPQPPPPPTDCPNPNDPNDPKCASDPVNGDPVTIRTGTVNDAKVDLTYPSGLSVERSYNSANTDTGVLGQGWAGPYETRFRRSGATTVDLESSNAYSYQFTEQPDGTYESPPSYPAELTERAGGLELRFRDGTTWGFDMSGFLVGTDDGQGHTTTITRDGQGRAVTVTAQPGGRTLTFTYGGSPSRLTSVAGPDGRAVTYSFDNKGRLRRVTKPDGRTESFTLDSAGRIVNRKDAAGTNRASYVYGPDGRVQSTVEPTGETTTFAYDDAKRTTTLTYAATGEVMVYAFDANGRLQSVRDPAGMTAASVFNPAGQLLANADRAGANTYRTYDSRGNLTQTRDSNGATTNLAVDANNRVTTSAGPGGAASFAYTGNDRLPTQTTTAAGTTTQTISAGRVLSDTDENGVTTGYSYDLDGNVTSITTPAGTTSYTYDLAGNRTSSTDRLGRTTSFTYDAVGRLLSSSDPSGATTTNAYDTTGRLRSTTDPTGGRTRYTYTSDGKIASITDPLGRVRTHTYNTAGQLVSTTNPDGTATTTTYGILSRVTATTDAAGHTTTYGHDANGRVITVTDPTGAVSRTVYDPAGRQIETIDPLGHQTRTTYDAAGRAVAVSDANGATSTTAYDAAGRVVATTDPSGATSRTTYNGARVAATTDPNGQTTTYGYDPAGRQVRVTDPLGGSTINTLDAAGQRVAVTTPAGRVTQYGYDPAGRPITVSDPTGATTTTTYDASGRILTRTDPTGGVITNTYDSAGQLKRVTDPNGGVTRYSYDAMGRRASRTNALGRTEAWAYTPTGQVASHTDPAGNQTTYAYDAAGRPTVTTDPSGRTRSNTYDLAGRLLTQTATGAGLATQTTSRSYDASGRVVSTQDGLGTTTYAYDPVGRMTQVAYPGGAAMGYEYDAMGRRTIVRYGTPGVALPYTYDANGRLVQVGDPGNLSVGYAYSYDPDGAMTAEAGTGGFSGDNRTWTHDPAGRPVTYTQTVAGTTYTRGIDRDLSGRITTITDPAGAAADQTFTYDQAGQLTAWTAGIETRTYAYDAIGGRVRQTGTGGTTNYTYDAAGQLQTVTGNGQTTSYTFDAAGRQTGLSAPGGGRTISYDANGRPDQIRTTTAGGTTEENRVYDGEGRLTTMATSSPDGGQDDHTLVWDPTSPNVPQIAADLHQGPTPNDSALTLFGYGAGRLAYAQVKSDATQATSRVVQFQRNELDDTIGGLQTPLITTPEGGTIFDTANRTPTTDYVRAPSYDPWGNPQSATPQQQRDITFGYRSELTTSDLVHLRARDYDPTTGTFTTRDSLDGVDGTTTVSNPYHYVNNDPLNKTDPTGLHPADCQANPTQPGCRSRTCADDPSLAPCLPPKRTPLPRPSTQINPSPTPPAHVNMYHVSTDIVDTTGAGCCKTVENLGNLIRVITGPAQIPLYSNVAVSVHLDGRRVSFSTYTCQSEQRVCVYEFGVDNAGDPLREATIIPGLKWSINVSVQNPTSSQNAVFFRNWALHSSIPPGPLFSVMTQLPLDALPEIRHV